MAKRPHPPSPFERTVRHNLLLIVESYRKATGQSLSAVSKKFYGNGDFFDKLRSGTHSISVARLGSMLVALHSEWPEGAKWPRTPPIFMSPDLN